MSNKAPAQSKKSLRNQLILQAIVTILNIILVIMHIERGNTVTAIIWAIVAILNALGLYLRIKSYRQQ